MEMIRQVGAVFNSATSSFDGLDKLSELSCSILYFCDNIGILTFPSEKVLGAFTSIGEIRNLFVLPRRVSDFLAEDRDPDWKHTAFLISLTVANVFMFLSTLLNLNIISVNQFLNPTDIGSSAFVGLASVFNSAKEVKKLSSDDEIEVKKSVTAIAVDVGNVALFVVKLTCPQMTLALNTLSIAIAITDLVNFQLNS